MENQKTQIVDRVKQATNILVAVSSNPTVDQLSAAIGLTLMLNHIGKHATAVFSGQVPSTLEFLQPEKTLEKNTDSLRDFIIALDKSKADKLRYKVEDQMVKIFITPYRTSISDKDLQFSQGDFNVEVVIALGVNDQADLDQAITSHGRILHDATVIGLGVNGGALGTMNWSDPAASSLCEMVTGIGLALKADVLDSQMATALLTGIVAETERFSNEKTSSETMQVSAKLMSAGANQQLVASQLEKPEPAPVTETPAEADVSEESADVAELPEVSEDPTPASESAEKPKPTELSAKESADGSLLIDHGEGRLADELSAEAAEPIVEQIHIDDQGILQSAKEVEAMKQKVIQPLPAEATEEPRSDSRLILEPPTLGGKLTANTEPENLDPATDPLGVSVPTGPMLSHEAPTAETPVAESPQDSLAELEKSVESPHVEDNMPAISQVPPSPADGGLDAARDAVLNAVAGVTPSVLEPVQALNAQPMDLNLDPQIATPPTIVDEPLNPMAEPVSDPGLPPGLVPVDPGLPADNTASVVTDPTAPPPVPPPMMPPMDPSRPSDTAL